ncbi:bifunctional DNA primase/polymerase [Streptomyces sp. NBC_01506]|uniref:bifunctional DNA primase/polymerase n=1 Tax=Streptomyces sp. NBC_01506 TaxID=2903887 RepID=UPI003865BE24
MTAPVTHQDQRTAAPTPALPPMIEFARWYAKRGWRVLPLHHAADGRCTCGNPRRDAKHDYKQGGKHPVYPAWQDNATTDPGQIATWWAERPRANIGIATGEASGIFVLDVDPDNGGFDSLTALETEHGPLPETRRHETGSGGLHFFFAWPGFNPRNSSGKLGPGLDIRADGGQVVAPPSVSVKGAYSPRGGPDPVQAPAWLVDMLRPPPLPEPLPPGTYTAPVGSQDAYTNKAVQAECDAITSAPEGTQNDTINRAAFSVGTLVGAGALSEGEARETLLSAARAGNHPEGRALATITSGLTAGMAQPRTPWPPVGRVDDRNDFSGLIAPEPEAATPAEPPAAVEPEAEEEPPNRFVRLDWHQAFATDFSKIEWLPGKFMERGQQVSIVGDGKVGKTLFVHDWLWRAVTGRSFLGDERRAPLYVLYFDRENGLRDIVTRMQGFGATAAELTERFDYRMFPKFSGGLDAAPLAVAELMSIVDEVRPDVVIFDTVSRFISGKENDSDTWLQFYSRVHAPLKSRGIAGTRLDHMGKDTDKGSRGSSAKSQDVDHVWEMTRLTADSAYDGDVETVTTQIKFKRTHTRTGVGSDLLHITRRGRKSVTTGMWLPGQTRHELSDPGVVQQQAQQVQHYVDQLVKLGAPNLGRDKLKDWATTKGLILPGNATVLAEVVRAFKASQQ